MIPITQEESLKLQGIEFEDVWGQKYVLAQGVLFQVLESKEKVIVSDVSSD